VREREGKGRREGKDREGRGGKGQGRKEWRGGMGGGGEGRSTWAPPPPPRHKLWIRPWLQ